MTLQLIFHLRLKLTLHGFRKGWNIGIGWPMISTRRPQALFEWCPVQETLSHDLCLCTNRIYWAWVGIRMIWFWGTSILDKNCLDCYSWTQFPGRSLRLSNLVGVRQIGRGTLGMPQTRTIRACRELRRLCQLFAQRCGQKKWTVTNVITYNGTYLPMKTLHFQDANIARAQDLEDAKSRLEIAWNGMKCARPPKKGTTIHHFPHDCRKNSGFGGIRVSRRRVSQV